MGRLQEMINKMSGSGSNELKIPTPTPIGDGKNTEQQKPLYDRTWLSRVVLSRGFTISVDDGKVDGILKALCRTSGHCPCGGNGDQYKCPCVNMREGGMCKCGLFNNIPERKISGSSSGAIN
jgi:ferredoxin-thioredoxin reductase catalytic subunit